MKMDIQLTTEPLLPNHRLPEEFALSAGAVLEFWGVVRGEEDGRAIAALEYEAYQPMAERVMRRQLEELAGRHPCLFVRVRQRLGVVPAGEAAFHMVVMARHRAEALAMIEEFMHRLKQDVPIWKRQAPSGETLPSGSHA